MKNRFWFCFALLLAVCASVAGCKSVTETASQPTQLFPASTLTPASLATHTPARTPLDSTATSTLAQDMLAPLPEPNTPSGNDAYPPPQETASPNTSTPPGAYPPPQVSSGEATSTPQGAYPPPQQVGESGVLPTSTGAALPAPSTLPAGFVQSPTPPSGTPTFGPTPTERLPQPFGLNITPSAGQVSIYHSWRDEELAALWQIIKSYQEYYPDVIFDLTYIPQADLLGRYTQIAYNGAGPDLLFGSSDWRASLAGQVLVEDLTPYISEPFRETFNPVALGTGQFQGSQVCLPYEQRGVLLYRNRKIIPEAPATFEQLVSLAAQATRAGTLGAYFEGGSYFSLAHLTGLGGQLLDSQSNPLFDRDGYRASLAWIGLLKAMKGAGALELNGDRDIQLFEDGKTGLIVEGSWNRNALAQAIGSENLVIDPWPTYQKGRLSGFVQSDCLYLNSNTRELSALDHQAALNFMGYFLTSPMQVRLAETGSIPVLIPAQPSDTLTRQAMLAFQGGVPYPAELDEVTRQVYFTALDGAVAGVIDQGQDPLSALQTAFDAIQKRIAEIR